MILNQAENIMLGSSEVAKVYVGTELVWSRIPPVAPVSNFELDTTAFSASNPVVYDTNSNIIGEIIAIGGNVSDCKTVNDGLEVSGSTSMRIPVNLPKNHAWTIIYCIKYFNNSGNVEFVFDSKNEELEACKDNSIYGIRHKFGANGLGDYTLLNNVYTFQSDDVQMGIWDEATRTSEMQYYNMDYRWICNGSTLSLFVNGVKKIETSLDSFPDNVQELGVPVYNNGDDSSASRMVITKLQVLDTAVTTPSHVVYKWSITDFRDYDTYFQFKRLCLYANETRIDGEEGCVAACWVDDLKPAYSSDAETVAKLTGNRTGKLCAERGETQDIYFCVPYELAAVDEYSYITADDYADRDPTSWTLYKSIDGCVTWRVLDTQSDIADPGRGTETQIFPITNPDPPAVDPEPPIPETTIKRITAQPPITFQADGSNLLDWEIYGASGGVGIAYTNLFSGTFENAYRNQGSDAKTANKNYYASNYEILPVEPETQYTVSFTGNVSLFGSIRVIYFDDSVTDLVNPTDVPAGTPSPWRGYAWINCPAGKYWGTFTTSSTTYYIRIVVGSDTASEVNASSIGNCMLNKGKYPYPYTTGQKYAIPLTINSYASEFFKVFSLDSPLGENDVLTYAADHSDIKTFGGPNTLNIETPVVPQVTIEYKNTPPTNYFNITSWLAAVMANSASAGGKEYTAVVGGTLTVVNGGFCITADGDTPTAATLSADWIINGYAVPIAVEQGAKYTLTWDQDNARPNTYIYIYNGRSFVASTQIDTQQYLTFTAPSNSIAISFQLQLADTEPQRSVTFTNLLLRKD